MRLAILVVFGTLNAIIARRKGFNPLLWFFAAGVLGLVALLFIPSANEAGIDEVTRADRRRKANITGMVVLGIALALFLVTMVFMLGRG